MILQVHPAFHLAYRTVAIQEAADQRRELQDLDKKSKHLAMEVHQPSHPVKWWKNQSQNATNGWFFPKAWEEEGKWFWLMYLDIYIYIDIKLVRYKRYRCGDGYWCWDIVDEGWVWISILFNQTTKPTGSCWKIWKPMLMTWCVIE